MADSTLTADARASDPMHTVGKAMNLAAQAARDGAADAQARVSEVMPAIGEFLSRLAYTTCYSVSYGVVFPTLMVARAVPKENALVHGLVDGAAAARDFVTRGRPASHEADAADSIDRESRSSHDGHEPA